MRTDKVVLIAGGAGSIGSALVERLATSGMSDLIVVDKDENQLESLRGKLVDRALTEPMMYVCDLRNRKHIVKIFSDHLPDMMFNCAAHKHVVSGQRNVSETVNNNLVTTENLLVAKRLNPECKFVHISTDKAVEPTSVMGASKMLCESMIRGESKPSDKNSIIRFGNVMGTQGSVLQIWKRQLEQDMAFTVTDLSMKRYMMTMDQACEQILRVVGGDSGTYILDMGEEVPVSELLANFRKAHDCPSHPIRIIGIKPGEKVSEKLHWPVEHLTHFSAGGQTIHRVYHSPHFDYLRALEISRSFDDDKTLECLRGLFGKGMA